MCCPGQQYCLKWNNHTNNMVKVFNQLLDDQNFCDVTLAVDGTQLKAHKLVLSACSSYFKELFVANPCKHPIVILKDMRLDDLKAIINFMYSGEVNVSQNQLGALLKTAEVLKVKGLTEVNEKQSEVMTNTNTSTNTKISTEMTSQQTPNVTSGCINRKKRRRRSNHPNNNTSASGESEHNSSQSEDSSDETSVKKTKDNSIGIIDTTSRSSKDSRSLLSETNVTKTVNKSDSQNSNAIQTRRRQTLQHSDIETSLEIQNEPNIDCDNIQRINNGNQSEIWPSSVEHNSALVLPTNETEDESDDMFDVKPIISFNESPTQVSNALAIREESSDMSNPNDSNAIAGPSSGQSGNIRTSLRSFGFQPIFTDSRSECPFCHKKIVNMRRHINEVHVGVLYQCQICCRKFKRKDKLNHHLITEHNI